MKHLETTKEIVNKYAESCLYHYELKIPDKDELIELIWDALQSDLIWHDLANEEDLVKMD